MQLAKYPRGRERARGFDAEPIGRSLHARPPQAPQPLPTGPTASTELVGRRVSDAFGKTVGRVEGTIQPDWMIIRHGRNHHLLAPVAEAVVGGEAVFLPFPTEAIEAAPEVDPGEPIPATALRAANEHYGQHGGE